MGGSQKYQTSQISYVLCVVRKVSVELEVKVDVEIDGAENGEAVGVSFLVDDEQSWAIFLPLFLIDVDEHFSSGDEEDNSVIFAEPFL